MSYRAAERLFETSNSNSYKKQLKSKSLPHSRFVKIRLQMKLLSLCVSKTRSQENTQKVLKIISLSVQYTIDSQ